MMLGSLVKKITRGNVIPRLKFRALLACQYILTTAALTFTNPNARSITISTLNSDEENAIVSAIEAYRRGLGRVYFLAPNPTIAKNAVHLEARRQQIEVTGNIEYGKLTYLSLLRSYLVSEITLSTHVLLPGRDFSRKRIHAHLTHGVGPKTDTSFGSPTNAIVSFLSIWDQALTREYKLPAFTPKITGLPRLDVLMRASKDRDILAKLGVDPDKKVLIWAPTYRSIRAHDNAIELTGESFSESHASVTRDDDLTIGMILGELVSEGIEILLKVHPHDADSYAKSGLRVVTNEELGLLGSTPYELFAAADALVTDYSSIFAEFALLDRPFALFCPDILSFGKSHRGFRSPHIADVAASVMLNRPDDMSEFISEILSTSHGQWMSRQNMCVDRLGISRSVSYSSDMFDDVLRLLDQGRRD